jgi:hypothetical protein
MSITLSALQKQRRDTAANWTTQNPTLLAGEIGLESDTGYWKVGDGTTAWASLAYVVGLGAEIPVSRLADGTARQLLQTAANGTDVEWASNIDVPGTLDVDWRRDLRCSSHDPRRSYGQRHAPPRSTLRT